MDVVLANGLAWLVGGRAASCGWLPTFCPYRRRDLWLYGPTATPPGRFCFVTIVVAPVPSRFASTIVSAKVQ